MMFRSHARGRRGSAESGQVLVIVAVGMLGFIAVVGLVVDSGYAWGQQRIAQNGADAAATAGSAVVQHHLAMIGSPTDGDVGCAVEAAADANGVDLDRAEYTRFDGTLFSPTIEVGACSPGGGGPIPNSAQGVKATTSEEFDTFLMGLMGFGQLTTDADATAVVGEPPGMCPADQGCAALPVTFPQTTEICDSNETRAVIEEGDGNRDGFDDDGVWEPWQLVGARDPLTASNLAIVPLCDTGPGSVGWIDFGCGNLETQISSPCNDWVDIPAWIHTQTGNVNCCEAELNDYAGPTTGLAEYCSPGADPATCNADKVLAIPIHNNTCFSNPSDPGPYSVTCPEGEWSGSGDNLNYHIPFWVGFKLDGAFVQGGDLECQIGPGQPILVAPQPAGKVGCLKGWFVELYSAPGPISIGPITRGSDVSTQVELIN